MGQRAFPPINPTASGKSGGRFLCAKSKDSHVLGEKVGVGRNHVAREMPDEIQPDLLKYLETSARLPKVAQGRVSAKHLPFVVSRNPTRASRLPPSFFFISNQYGCTNSFRVLFPFLSKPRIWEHLEQLGKDLFPELSIANAHGVSGSHARVEVSAWSRQKRAPPKLLAFCGATLLAGNPISCKEPKHECYDSWMPRHAASRPCCLCAAGPQQTAVSQKITLAWRSPPNWCGRVSLSSFPVWAGRTSCEMRPYQKYACL